MRKSILCVIAWACLAIALPNRAIRAGDASETGMSGIAASEAYRTYLDSFSKDGSFSTGRQTQTHGHPTTPIPSSSIPDDVDEPLGAQGKPLSHPQMPTGAVDPRTGTFYAPAGEGLVNTKDGRYLSPAGPNGYIDTRTGEFVPAFGGTVHPGN